MTVNRINSSYLVSEFCHFVCVGLVGTAGGSARPAPAPREGGQQRRGPGRAGGPLGSREGCRGLAVVRSAPGAVGPQRWAIQAPSLTRPPSSCLPSQSGTSVCLVRVCCCPLSGRPLPEPALSPPDTASGIPGPVAGGPGGGGAAPCPVPPGPWGSPAAPSAHRARQGPQKWQRPAASRQAEGSPEGAGVLFLFFLLVASSPT